jgi:predicted dehydrogenase
VVDVLLLGAGVMAGNQVRAFRQLTDVEIVAVVAPRSERRSAFAAEHQIARTFSTVEEALDWGRFGAATNVSPDPAHHPTTIALLAAGKHVLCEKPLSTSYPLALEMAEAAKAAGVVNMINLSYRDAAALQEARRRVMAGELGDIRHVAGSYLQSWLVGDAWKDQRRRLSKVSSQHSGPLGALGDTGVHLLDFLTYASNLEIVDLDCRLQRFAKVEDGRIGDYAFDVNDSYVLSIEMGNGAVGNLDGSRLAAGHLNDLSLRLHGTKGALRLFTNGRMSSLQACLGQDVVTGQWQEIACPPVPSIYQRFIGAVRNGVSGEPDFRRGAEIQRLIDLAFGSAQQLQSA